MKKEEGIDKVTKEQSRSQNQFKPNGNNDRIMSREESDMIAQKGVEFLQKHIPNTSELSLVSEEVTYHSDSIESVETKVIYGHNAEAEYNATLPSDRIIGGRIQYSVDHIAKLCHEANRAICEAFGDISQPTWEEAPDWQKESARSGVTFHLSEERMAAETHENWMREKLEGGWVYGEVKDPEKKTHPCLVPYEDLPPEQKVKDYVFKSIVDSHKGK